MDNTQKPQICLSLCTGSRGLEKGVERAGTNITIAAYVEIEAFIIQNLVEQMEKNKVDPAPVWTNLKTFPMEGFRNKIHGVFAGYPCQPFSNAGRREGINDPRHLYPFISKLFKSIKPVWGFFENVEGHLSLGFDIVYKDLRAMGYIVESGIFSAREVGAPHQRKRIFILAVLGNSEYHGLFAEQKFRSDEKTRSNSSEEQKSTIQLKRTNFRRNANSNESFQRRIDRNRKILANTYGNGTGRRYGKLLGSGKATKRTKSRKNWKRSRYGTRVKSEIYSQFMANTNGKRFSRFRHKRFGKGSVGLCRGNWKNKTQKFHRNVKWPAGPLQKQFEWEEPRAVKPGLGCTVDGYNFRKDLLRMYGNGVVEQVAEKAWIELHKKMLKNFELFKP